MNETRIRSKPARVAGWVGALLWPLVAAAQAPTSTESPVTLHYVQRPPYMMVKGEGLVGLTGGPSYQAFKLAQVPVRIEETPFARQLRSLKENTGQDCMIGMFWKAEREEFGRYSKPVYQDQPQLILAAAASQSRFKDHTSVEDVFNDKSLRLLVKLAYSYGAPLDALIEKMQPTRRATPDENLQMVRQIKLGMADYMLMAPEEAGVAIEAAGFQPADFVQIRYKSMPAGEHRHLFCSKNVPVEVMQRLDAAIKKLTDRAPPR
ncbi:substrate-binding periplasmic protein [Inhella gelatinilytica]|uniref:Transporter substrate-binding domain-containing protein n=1 Tax=Inhella gelatinilytica TaxID=2795030 RepID=A0A931NBY5_9BURK|nr:transporter substrate-binding domain-containing protein [Inhella gelatinilytica]MBH9551417.1 transporter substrate-binding domain-containing protein [Inhella gelatinilytica]